MVTVASALHARRTTQLGRQQASRIRLCALWTTILGAMFFGVMSLLSRSPAKLLGKRLSTVSSASLQFRITEEESVFDESINEDSSTKVPFLKTATDDASHFDQQQILSKEAVDEREAETKLEEEMTGRRTARPFTYDIEKMRKNKRLPSLYVREDLADILQYEKMQTGAELGVLRGSFAMDMLRNWTHAKRYLLVDAWQPLENYLDTSFGGPVQQSLNYRTAMERVKPYKAKIAVCANFTTVCAKIHHDMRFDFVYVDARHDYKGVLLDLHDWWPLVREGGIMAGHDYVTQLDVGVQVTKQNWTVNYDGSVDEQGRAVKGAVHEFFGDPAHPDRFRVIHSTKRYEMFPTWMVRK